MGVHTGAIDAKEWFGKEGSVQAVLRSNGFEDIFGGYQCICYGQGMTRFKVQFVLTRGNFMVAGVDANAHLLERLNHLAAHCCGQVGGEIKIAAAIMGKWPGSCLVILQQEKLQFWSR